MTNTNKALHTATLKPLADGQYRALCLLRANPGVDDLGSAGHALINAHVKALLKSGHIKYAPSRKSGYRLTTLGYHVTDADAEVYMRAADEVESVSGVNDDGSEWTLRIGDRVTCDADSGDAGRIGSFVDSATALVYWDSGVATPVAVSELHSEDVS